MDPNTINNFRVDYIRAYRCWQSNNLKSCSLICEDLSIDIQKCLFEYAESSELIQLKHLIKFLKLRCLADDYYVNESLLLDEADIENEDQIRVINRTKTSTTTTTTTRRLSRPLTAARMGTPSFRNSTANDYDKSISRNHMNTQAGGSIRTGVLTGRMPNMVSRHSSSRSRATTSYRPLTTNLTATQTAFSRSTRPLLKYSTCKLISKLAFEYLYNAQAVTNKCPDYRQCLEYLNLVQNSTRKQQKFNDNIKVNDEGKKFNKNKERDEDENLLIKTNFDDSIINEKKYLGVFWLISFGTCYFNLHMNRQAEEYFQLALSINKKFLDSYTWLIKIYLRTNQALKVLKICQDGLLYSKNSILYNWLARIQSLMNDLYLANINLRESLKYYPTNIEALAHVGYFNFYSDKLEQSLKCFQRIQQISINQSINIDNDDMSNIEYGSSAQLLNNLALCNLYCGFYHKVMPLFLKAFQNSPNKEITSTIWYNISFVPLVFGFKNLAIACLRLALKNDSQNEEAINNLGVLKFQKFIDDDNYHYTNKQELWGSINKIKKFSSNNCDSNNNDDDNYLNVLKNFKQKDPFKEQFDEIETYFKHIKTKQKDSDYDGENYFEINSDNYYSQQPELLYNMALIKKRRGQLLASVRYCNLYLEHDEDNYHIKKILKEIQQFVSHDG